MCPHPNWSHPDHDACGTGLLAQLRGSGSHDLVRMSLTALERLTHRGGVDADGASGDGAGLRTSLPEEFLRKAAEHEGIKLPDLFGLGMVFVPAASEQGVRSAVEVAARAEQIRVVGWRRVPTDPSTLGPRALATMPRIWQFFVAPSRAARGAARFEARLTSLRKRAELLSPKGTYFCSVSSRMVVYKGLLTPWQLPKFYADLRDESFEISFSIFHQRYSTNTKPSWQLAQPFRYTAHNGEINTIVSNRRGLRARGAQIRERLGVGEWFGLLEENVSDSASFDNGFELKIRQGQSAEDTIIEVIVEGVWKWEVHVDDQLDKLFLLDSKRNVLNHNCSRDQFIIVFGQIIPTLWTLPVSHDSRMLLLHLLGLVIPELRLISPPS